MPVFRTRYAARNPNRSNSLAGVYKAGCGHVRTSVSAEAVTVE